MRGLIKGTTHPAHRMFSKSEQETSSIYGELLAIALQTFRPLLKNCNVKLFTETAKRQCELLK